MLFAHLLKTRIRFISGKIGQFYLRCIFLFVCSCLSGLTWSSSVTGFTLVLKNGAIYGPGRSGKQPLADGKVNNFIVTAPLTGYVPMRNNGKAEPNVLAESLHVGRVDGRLSDSTIINENVDAGFVLNFEEPESKEQVKLFVTSISEEHVTANDDGDLVFGLTAGFDPGLPEYVVTMQVEFVTGLTRLPLSIKSQKSRLGGTDRAGKYESGYFKVGRLGDFNNDGYLDGEFVLSGNAPEDLILAEGDPILVIRPFETNIPVSGKMAAIYTLRGLTKHYFSVLNSVKDEKSWRIYLEDIADRVESIKSNLNKSRGKRRSIRHRKIDIISNTFNVTYSLDSFTLKLNTLNFNDKKLLPDIFNMLNGLEKDIKKSR